MTTTFSGAATGTLNFAGDSDWFGTTLQAGTQYVFNLGNGTLTDPQVTIYNSAGQAVYTGTGNGAGGPTGENTQIVFSPTSTGTYYIAAQSASGQLTGSFALIESTATTDFLGNVNTTGTVAIGGTVNGNLSVTGQNDWFKVTLNAGQEYSFSASGSGLDPLVTVYDSTGKALQSGTDFENLSGGQVVFTATTGGTYYIGVGTMNSATGAFTLTASQPAFDYGDTPATAGTVTVGGTATGHLTAVQQRDWFGVTLQAGTQYTFSVSGGTLGGNATVALYDANGNSVVSQISGGTSNGALRTYTPTTTGTYYVEAGGLLGGTGTFTVGVKAIGTEANQANINSAGAISATAPATGTLTTPGDANWFKAALTAGTTYTFKMTDGTLSGAQVSLYDSTGKLITGYGASGSGAAEIVFTPTASGTYFVGAAGQVANTGSYTVTEGTVTPDFLGNINTRGTVAAGSSASGTLATPGQSDWYKITLVAGTQYVFTASGAISDADVTLYNSSGTAVATNGGSQASYLPTASGTYFVGVSSPSEATGAFSVAVSTVTDTYPASSATTGVFTSAAAEVSAFKAGTLKTANAISDSVANVAANLDGLEAVVKAGLLTSITLTDDQISQTPTLTLTAAQFTADHDVLGVLKGSYTLAVPGFSSSGLSLLLNTQGQGVRYSPGANASGTTNQAIEISSIASTNSVTFGSGYNMVIIDGTHDTSGSGTFSFNVQANGVVTVHDNGTGQNETITGANYLIFNNGGTNIDGSFQSVYFIEGSTNSQITSLYNAAFLRQPDLIGLEYYAQPIAAGTLSLHQTAVNFLASPEFLQDYPTAALAPDKGGAHDQAFINTLYENVLDRAPSAAEVAYYVQELNAGTKDRAQLLIDFSASPENQAKITNFLINTTNGAYADSDVPLAPATVLGEVTANGSLNTAAMSSVTSALTANGITLTPGSGGNASTITLTSTAPTETVYLSQTYANVVVNNNNSVIVDSAANSTITVNGDSTYLQLGHGGIDTINVLGGTNTQILSFIPGSGATVNVANTSDAGSLQILNGTTAPVANLAFNANSNYIVNIGNVGGGTAAEVVTAANKAYTVADVAGEHVTFMGQTTGGDTVFYFFGSTAGASNGTIPASSLSTSSADLNGNHLVDANEIVHVVTLLAINSSTLTVNDLA